MEPLGAAILVAVILLYFIGRALRGGKSEREDGPGGADVPAAGGGAASASADIYDIAARLTDFYEASAHPEDLRDNNADFDQGVRLLCTPSVTIDTLVNYVTGDNAIISLLAIEASMRRADGKSAYRAVAGCIGTVAPWPQYFGLRYLVRMTPPDTAIIGRVLAQTTSYLGYRLSRSFLTQFIEDRLQAGEEPSFEDATVELDKGRAARPPPVPGRPRTAEPRPAPRMPRSLA